MSLNQELVKKINESVALLSKSTLEQVVTVVSANEQLSRQFGELNRINLSIQIPDIYSALSIDKAFLTRIQGISNELVRITQATPVWQESFSQQISDLVSGLNIISRRFSADLTAFRLSFIDIDSAGLFRNLIELAQESVGAAEAFREAGWPIAPSMSKQLKDRVVELHGQGKSRYASQTIMGYYRRNNHENLVAVVTGWCDRSLFSPRMHIFEDALEAHQNGYYTLSVPTLLAQIEGILNDYVHVNGLPARFGRITEVYNTAIGDLDEYGLSAWAIANTLLYQLQSNTYAYTSFERELSKIAQYRETTRHTVLHGVALTYDKPSNSLKAFLILDSLAILRDVE